MLCPICGRPLSLLGEVLAATEMGAQCHGCWKHLRRMKSPLRPARVTPLPPAARRHAAPTLRRAA